MRDDCDGASLRARPLYYFGVLFNWLFVWIGLMVLWVSMSEPTGMSVVVVAGLSLVGGMVSAVIRIRRCGVDVRHDGVCVQRFFSGRVVAAADVVKVTHRTVRFMGGNAQIPVIHMLDKRVVAVPSSCGATRDVTRLRRLLKLGQPHLPTVQGMTRADCECHVQLDKPSWRPRNHA